MVPARGIGNEKPPASGGTVDSPETKLIVSNVWLPNPISTGEFESTDAPLSMMPVENGMIAVVPAGPVGPDGPVAPVGPAGPVAPVGPAGPVAPVAPVAPVGPAGPVAPVGPAGPVAPVRPVAPAGPGGPVG